MREHVFQAIRAIENGTSLREAARNAGIDAGSLIRHIQEDKEAAKQYARAQEVAADILADEVIQIADTEEDAQKARNRIDARKWKAAKSNPKKYGDRIDLNVSTTIEIGATLAEARARLRPPSDLAKTIDGELIESIALSPIDPSDKESQEPDIFS